jgi:hypothetical protein
MKSANRHGILISAAAAAATLKSVPPETIQLAGDYFV